MKFHALLISFLLLFAPAVFAQQRPLSCGVARDRALTRVSIVSNSRVLMEEDLAALSVTLRSSRQAVSRMKLQIETLKEQLKIAQTKDAEPEAKETEEKPEAPSDVKAGEKEKEAEKPEGIEEEQTQ